MIKRKENEMFEASLTLRNFTGAEVDSVTVFSQAALASQLAEWSLTLRNGDTISVELPEEDY